jgi:predicted nuclease with TOPRIM domain
MSLVAPVRRDGIRVRHVFALLGIVALAMGLYGQSLGRQSYRDLEEENETLRGKLAEVHSEAEDAQSELDTLKSDIDDVQTRANDCEDCDEVQSAASDLDGPVQNLESNLETIETTSQE